MYGPTETTIWSTCSRVTEPTDIHIGRPIDNTEIYILDAHQQPLPVGLAGELLIGGDGLARGYHHRPELTADRFVAHPFKPGARLYRTGDLARYRADGNIDCLGRLDFQVKIRGFRIELGEIEAQLASHPGIRQAVVAAREDSPGNKRLVAYLVAKSEPAPTSADLRDQLRGKLPEYMVPAVFVYLPSLPLTPNGKVDRKSLPVPESSAIAATDEVIGPRSDAEQRLVTIFERVLGRPVPSVRQSFFDLGGHSLLAVKLMNLIERDFGKRLPLARLFVAPTIEQLALELTERPAAELHWDSLVPIQPQKDKPLLFLIHGAGGNVLLYREVVKAIGPALSLYGFQSQGLDHKTMPLTTVESMAEHYVRELKIFLPAGPYHLAGYCMGGAIAYEMARLLRREGANVGLVALLDTYNLNEVREDRQQRSKFSVLSQKVGLHFNNLTHLKAKDLFGYIGEKLRMAEEAGKGKIAASLNSLKNAVGGAAEDTGAEVHIQDINHEAAWNFVPQPLAAGITAFSPRKNYDFFPDPKMGWSKLVNGPLEIVELPVNPHAMLVEPCATMLANELKKRLGKGDDDSL
jgi:thioesterase domain-containing protein